MDRFTMDNTEGYTEDQIVELNEAFDEILARQPADIVDDIHRKSYEDHVAEKLLVDYDDGKRGNELTR